MTYHFRIVFLLCLIVGLSLGCVQSHMYKQIWDVCHDCENPESVYYDTANDILFVSNVAGEGDKKDGKGWISKLKTNGEVIKSKWVEGLNAPKGMRSFKDNLWVSDIDEVLSIDMKTGKIMNRIKIEKALFLNDVAVDTGGTVYVSDTLASRIYQIQGGKASVFVEGVHLNSPNGLLVEGNNLYVAAWGANHELVHKNTRQSL